MAQVHHPLGWTLMCSHAWQSLQPLRTIKRYSHNLNTLVLSDGEGPHLRAHGWTTSYSFKSAG